MGFWDIVDRQVDKGRRAGLFDDLPGHGKPIADLGRRREEGWWAANFVKTERARIREEELTKRLRQLRYSLRRASDETEVRTLVGEVNAEIQEHNRLSRDLDIGEYPEVSVDEELERFRRR